MGPVPQETATPGPTLIGPLCFALGLSAGASLHSMLWSTWSAADFPLAPENGGGTFTGARNVSLPWLMGKLDYSKKYDVCSIGAGLSGTIFAERYATVLTKKALVIDSRDHIGGNCFDYVDGPTGVLMNKWVEAAFKPVPGVGGDRRGFGGREQGFPHTRDTRHISEADWFKNVEIPVYSVFP